MSQKHWQSNSFNVRDTSGGALTNTSLKATPGTGMALYITDIVCNCGGTGRTFQLLDGSGGTVLWQATLSANGNSYASFETPLKCSSNTALCVTNGGASTGALIAVNGFIARG